MADKKKVLHIVTKSNWGGAQRYVFDLATSLPAEEFSSLVAFGGSGALSEKLAEAGIPTASIPSLKRDVALTGDIRSFLSLVSLFKKEKPDIVHLNSSKIGGLGALAARAAGVRKIVFTCHGWAFNEERSFLSRSAIWTVSWITALLSHDVIAVSERDLRDGKKMPWAKEKMRLVHNGIRSPIFIAKTTARAHLLSMLRAKGIEIGNKDFLVGTIGELHKNKGHRYLIQAASKMREDIGDSFRIIVMGEGEERGALESLISKHGLEKNIFLFGFVKDASIHIKGFDAFVLSSVKEGLPYVVLEAGMAGSPVVATSVGGMREIIDDMQSGILVQPRKHLDIARALIFLRSQSAKAKAFGAALKERVNKEFSLELMVSRTAAIYRETR